MICLECDKCGSRIDDSEEAIETYASGGMTSRILVDKMGSDDPIRFRVLVRFHQMSSAGGKIRDLQLCHDCKIALLGYVAEEEWE